MTFQYVLSPEAVADLFEIWMYIKEQTNLEAADQIEAAIRKAMAFLAHSPGVGHRRTDLTDKDLRFFSVYSFLIIYRPGTLPLQVVSILHGRRDLRQLLQDRP